MSLPKESRYVLASMATFVVCALLSRTGEATGQPGFELAATLGGVCGAGLMIAAIVVGWQEGKKL